MTIQDQINSHWSYRLQVYFISVPRIRLPFNGCFCVPEGGPCPDGAADKAGEDPYINVYGPPYGGCLCLPKDGTNFSPYQITRRAETAEVLKQPADRDYYEDYDADSWMHMSYVDDAGRNCYCYDIFGDGDYYYY